MKYRMTLQLSKDITEQEVEQFCDLNSAPIAGYHTGLNKHTIVSDNIGTLLFIGIKYSSSIISLSIKNKEEQ